ncbi:MAG: patatin-like phospholipase family protein [Nitrospira sp.]|nr:patatin-like phospholipase family protein [Nitrospira sp.]
MHSDQASPDNHSNYRFRILSLDGGGIRGAFTAACLAEFEKQIGSPLTNYFDLIAGTSTGGIIALGLALGKSAEDIRLFYEKYGHEIFTRQKPIDASIWERLLFSLLKHKLPTSFDLDCLLQSKYSSAGIKRALTEVMSDKTLADIVACRIVIPSVDLIAGKVIAFKTPHLPNLIRDRYLKAVDVALAATAAPTYFPHAEISPGSAYVDGGLWVNNPSTVAYAEAMKIGMVCKREAIDPIFTPADISILSIGTGKPRLFVEPDSDKPGIAWWGPRIMNTVAFAQSQGEHFKTKYFLEDRYMRIDFDLPPESWDLDSVNSLKSLLHIGRQQAIESFEGVRQKFFSSKVLRFHPFPAFSDH